MMCADADRGPILLDHSLPPSKSLATHDAARVSAERTATDFLRRFVDVTHHQEQNIPDSKRVPLPGSLYWKRSLVRIDMRGLRVFARGVNPCAPPPSLRFTATAPVVIARQIVDLLATMVLEHTELPDDLRPFRVFR